MKSYLLQSHHFLCANLVHPIAEDTYMYLSNVYGPRTTLIQWCKEQNGRPLTSRGWERG